MRVFVKMAKPERTICLEVEPTHSIAQIKKQIQYKTGVPPNEQQLFMELQDDLPLWNYNIKYECTVKMARNLENEMIQIPIKTLTGKNFTVQMRLDDTVLSLKKKIFLTEGIHFEQQRLILGYRQMEDERKLYEYDIQNGSHILIVLRLTGC